MSVREIRSLVRLAQSASAARALNLIAVHRDHRGTDDYRRHPVFKSPALNRSIIVKHRLRPHEMDAFDGQRRAATKVIIPFEVSDLKLGAQTFFINQNNYEQFLGSLNIKDEDLSHDKQVLEIIDKLPSLDPFLSREKLKLAGFSPARCYFDLTQADSKAMFDIVRAELRPLIGLSFDGAEAQVDERTDRLAEKILQNAADSDLEPLRVGLGMQPQQFSEGIFCWKGFIYYKWRLGEVYKSIGPVTDEITRIKTSDTPSYDEKLYIDGARDRLKKSIDHACQVVGETIQVYDAAYRDLTRNGNAVAFREFLLRAPKMFHELGERLGAVDHIASFWRYRFPIGQFPKVNAEELADLFADFENSLSFTPKAA